MTCSMTGGSVWVSRPVGSPRSLHQWQWFWSTQVHKTMLHLALLSSLAWGVVELFALQRSRYQAWRLRF